MNRARWSGYYHGVLVGGFSAMAGTAVHFGSLAGMGIMILAAVAVFINHVGNLDAKNTPRMGGYE
jgi:hypothetical protein